MHFHSLKFRKYLCPEDPVAMKDAAMDAEPLSPTIANIMNQLLRGRQG